MTAMYAALAIWGGVFFVQFSNRTRGLENYTDAQWASGAAVMLALTIGVCGLIEGWIG